MKTCLIVDDSKVVRMVARKILEGLNFEIAEAEDGQQALDVCMDQMPHAVLLDWNMPVKNGLEFLQELRALEGVDQPIVVFCTTENDMTPKMPMAERSRARPLKTLSSPLTRVVLKSASFTKPSIVSIR